MICYIGILLYIFWKRLIRGSEKPGKLREFNFAEFVSILICALLSDDIASDLG